MHLYIAPIRDRFKVIHLSVFHARKRLCELCLTFIRIWRLRFICQTPVVIIVDNIWTRYSLIPSPSFNIRLNLSSINISISIRSRGIKRCYIVQQSLERFMVHPVVRINHLKVFSRRRTKTRINSGSMATVFLMNNLDGFRILLMVRISDPGGVIR